MSTEYVRICPACGADNPPEAMRCACGALLAGVDLTAKVALAGETPSHASSKTEEKPASTALDENGPLCAHADCGMSNPPGSSRCLYCDRPLGSTDDGLSGTAPATPSLLQLPSSLRARYEIREVLPATGAEAELLIVAPVAGGETRIAKIYRHGIHPNREVQTRLAQIDAAHRVEVIESGIADGFAFEVMEFCREGSLRDLLRLGRLDSATLRAILEELSDAIAAVHAADLIHRDLKPENVLLRRREPLDLVLTDFGIASLQNATLRFTGVARTLAYSAPESLSGVIDGQTDWWSLGMILLEAITGAHPFAGLSDVVILHQLTTRPIDLSAVDNQDWRKLLSGLLLRDPKQRWASAEITQWLRDPQRLAAPVGERTSALAGKAYQIGNDLCETAEQLAVGLTRNWSKAVSDLDNGLLMNWLRSELKDQNVVRYLLDLNLQRTLHVDVRLLRLILFLAPGIPPVWRGESLNLRNILSYADRALKKDDEAIAWLEALRTYKVLEAYAAAGNTEIADILQRWQGGLDAFATAWQAQMDALRALPRSARDVVLFDDAMYGHGGPIRPSPQQLHARLLALAYDEGWLARLRKHLQIEGAKLAVRCPWLPAVGDVSQLDGQQLLAFEALLPEARKQAARMEASAAAQAAEDEATYRMLASDITLSIASLRELGIRRWFFDDDCRALIDGVERFVRLSAQLRSEARTSEAHLQLRNRVARLEPYALRLAPLAENLIERRAQNRGWFSREVFGFFALALLIVPAITDQRLVWPMIITAGALAAWRLLPNFFTQRKLRALATRID